MSSVENNVEREIIALHQFFESWFKASIKKEEFASLENVLDPEFEFIGPSGAIKLERSKLLQEIRKGYGKNSMPGREMRLSIEKVEVRKLCPEVIIATYHAKQHFEFATTVRLSTAVLKVSPAQRNGLSWLHVHETWVTN